MHLRHSSPYFGRTSPAAEYSVDYSEDTEAIRALNEKIAGDPRVEAYLAPVGDGVHLAWKR